MRINNPHRAIINNTPYTLAKHSTMFDDMEIKCNVLFFSRAAYQLSTFTYI